MMSEHGLTFGTDPYTKRIRTGSYLLILSVPKEEN